MPAQQAHTCSISGLLSSFLDELSEHAVIDFINDDVHVARDGPICRLLMHEEAGGHATSDGRVATLGGSDVNVIANVWQQHHVQ